MTITGLGIVIFLTGCAVRYLVICRQAGKSATFGGLLGYTFPLKRLITHSSRIDLTFYAFNKFSRHLLLITNVVLAVWLSQVVGAALAARFGGGGLQPGLAIVALAYLLAFLPRDLTHYAVHYLHHKLPILWEFHKVHHAATYLTPLTTERTHPIEDQIFSVAEGLAMGLALGLLRWRYAFNDADLLVIIPTAAWAARMLVLSPLQHSQAAVHFGVLDPVFYSPSLHQVHHSSDPRHWDRNFGECLSIWDSLFGTYHRLGDDAPVLGLPHGDHANYMTLLACYFRPFGRAYRLVVPDRPSTIREEQAQGEVETS